MRVGFDEVLLCDLCFDVVGVQQCVERLVGAELVAVELDVGFVCAGVFVCFVD